MRGSSCPGVACASAWRAIGVFLAAAVLALAQTDRKPGGVEGVVLNAITNEPLAKAHVTLRAPVKDTVRKYGAISDEKGRFWIQPMDPGSYATSVELRGFLFAPRKAADNGHVEIAEDTSLNGLKLKMVPQGVITGRVLDANGDAVERVAVAALRGARHVGEQTTDAAGEFRIGGLPEGKYLVQAAPPNREGPPEVRTDGSREERYGITWFAGAVEVHAGAEVSGVEIRLVRAPIVRVSGTVSGIPQGAGRVTLNRTILPYTRSSAVTGGQFAFVGAASRTCASGGIHIQRRPTLGGGAGRCGDRRCGHRRPRTGAGCAVRTGRTHRLGRHSRPRRPDAQPQAAARSTARGGEPDSRGDR